MQMKILLNIQKQPCGWQSRFTGGDWRYCSKEHHDWVKSAPSEFFGYEVREQHRPRLPLWIGISVMAFIYSVMERVWG
jgi:hypothetical protein